MSILCTLYLKDGIILASETRATHSIEENGKRVITGKTDDLNKTFLITPHNVGVSFCDNAKFNNMIMEDYLRNDFIKTLAPDDNVITIAEKLYDKLKENSTQLIISGYIGDIPYVYKTEQGLKLLNRNNDVVIYGMEVRGRYEKACDYFETCRQERVIFGNLSLEEGVDLARDIISFAINHEDSCGGEISVLIIQNGNAKWVR